MLTNEKYKHMVACGDIIGVRPLDDYLSKLYYQRAQLTAIACSPIGVKDWFAASRTIPYVRIWQDELYGTYYAKDMRDVLFHKENDSDDTFICSNIAYYFWKLNEDRWAKIVNGILYTNPSIPEKQAWNMAREAIINQEMKNYMVIPYKLAIERANNDPEQVRRVNEQYSKIGYRDMYIKITDLPKLEAMYQNNMQTVNAAMQNPQIQALANKIKELSAKFGHHHHGPGCSCGHDHHHDNSHQVASMPVDDTEVAVKSVLTDKYYNIELPKKEETQNNLSFDKLITPTVNVTNMPDMVNPVEGSFGTIGNYHPNAYGNYNYDANTYAQQYQWENQQRLYREQQMRAYQQFMNPNVGATQMPTPPPPAPGFGINPSPLFPKTPVQNTAPQQSKFSDVKSKADAMDKLLENNPGYSKKANGEETLDLGKMFGDVKSKKKDEEVPVVDLVDAVKGLASTMKNGANVVADVESKMKETQTPVTAPPQPSIPMMGFNPLFHTNSTMQNMYNQPSEETNPDGSYRYPEYSKGYRPGDEYLIPTREEIESGERFYAWAEINGKSTFDPTLNLPKYENKTPKKKSFDVCLMTLDENGKERFYGEDKKFVKETKKKYYQEKRKEEAAMSYKDASVMIQDMDRETELYLLISTMKKYNQYVADKLAFMKDDASVSAEDFADMLDNTLTLLESYQKKDPLASVKSPGVRVENKKLIIDKSTQNVQDAMKRVIQIHDIKNKKYSDIQTAMRETGLSAAEIQTIMKYSPVNPHDIITGKIAPEYQGVKVQNDIFSQIQIPQNNEPLSEEAEKINESLITQLQSMTNIRVVNSEEEYDEIKDWESKVYQMNPYLEDRKAKYLFWKARMRNGDNKNMSDEEYNKWFDKWWNSPTANYANGGYYNGYYYNNMSRKDRARLESDRRTLRLAHADMMSPYVQECQATMFKESMRKLMASRDAMTDSHTLYDFVYGSGLSKMNAANIREQYNTQVNKVRRRFNAPMLYNNMMNGTYATPSFSATPQQYDSLMHSDKYNDRRQRFINKIFSKEEMRPTNKRYSYE